MKSLLRYTAIAAVAAFGILSTNSAMAQMGASQMVNCAALSGLPVMCIKNESSFPIVAIQAYDGNAFGNTWIPIPGGQIAPGGTTIVRFATGWTGSDMKSVAIKTASGQTHSYPPINTRTATSFVVRGW